MVPEGGHQANEATACGGISLTKIEKTFACEVRVVVKLLQVQRLLVFVLSEESCQIDATWDGVIQAEWPLA